MTTKKAKKKPRRIWLRFRKDDPAHNVQAAVQKWLHANGGDAVVIGGVGIIRDGGSAMRFHVAVTIVGRLPVKKED